MPFADAKPMRLSRFAWVLSPLGAVGGIVLIAANALCTSPGVWVGPMPERCDVRFLGMTLSQNAATWLSALIGGVLGAALAFLIYRPEARRRRSAPPQPRVRRSDPGC